MCVGDDLAGNSALAGWPLQLLTELMWADLHLCRSSTAQCSLSHSLILRKMHLVDGSDVWSRP